MYWHCEICDNIMNAKLKNKHLESNFHSSPVNSIIRRCIIPNPKSNEIDETIRKYLTFQYKKHNKFQKVFLLKLLMTSNQNKYNRIQRSSRAYELCLTQAFFFFKIKISKEQQYAQLL